MNLDQENCKESQEQLRKAKWFLAALTAGVMFQGFCTTGLVKVVTSTIERRFSLNSTQSGLVNSAFDIGTLLLMIPITYLGGRKSSHKPRWIGSGLLIVGLGGFLWTVPHFIFPSYNENANSIESSSSSLGIFIIAQILIGAGAAAIVSLGVAFLDDNVDSKRSPLYIAVFQSGTVLGPALGKGRLHKKNVKHIEFSIYRLRLFKPIQPPRIFPTIISSVEQLLMYGLCYRPSLFLKTWLNV